MSKSVKLKINASLGKIDLQCSEGYFEDAMGLCIEAFSTYQGSGVQPRSAVVVGDNLEAENSGKASRSENLSSPKPVNSTPAPHSEVEKPKRQRSNAGKAASYSQVDLGLTDDQCRELKQFYEGKAPSVQNDIVATAAVKLKELTGKSEFSRDEIFSALRLIGGVKTPKSLKAVINNMNGMGLAGKNDGKLVVNFATEDRVNLELPESKKDN